MSKLVRDRVPEILQSTGASPKFHVASEEEFEAKLREKLIEEAREFSANGEIEELADILEVIRTFCELKNTSPDELESIRLKKAEERGSFSRRLIRD